MCVDQKACLSLCRSNLLIFHIYEIHKLIYFLKIETSRVVDCLILDSSLLIIDHFLFAGLLKRNKSSDLEIRVGKREHSNISIRPIAIGRALSKREHSNRDMNCKMDSLHIWSSDMIYLEQLGTRNIAVLVWSSHFNLILEPNFSLDTFSVFHPMLGFDIIP